MVRSILYCLSCFEKRDYIPYPAQRRFKVDKVQPLLTFHRDRAPHQNALRKSLRYWILVYFFFVKSTSSSPHDERSKSSLSKQVHQRIIDFTRVH